MDFNPSRLPLARQLMIKLVDISEINLCGFVARSGLSGSGITLLRGQSYFGSWRDREGRLAWIGGSAEHTNRVVGTVDEAARYTMLLILRDLQTSAAPSGIRLRVSQPVASHLITASSDGNSREGTASRGSASRSAGLEF